MDQATLLTALNGAGLDRVSAALAGLARPSIRLTSSASAEDALPVGGSKLGGLPDLAPGTAWPDLRGVPMAFVAQIRLDDAAPYDAEHLLPATGLLSFFYDAQQQTFGADPADRAGWRVVYDDGDRARLQRLPAPDALPAAARFTACALAFAGELTLPAQPTLDQPSLSLTADEQQHYEQLLAAFPSQADHAAIHNRMLGYPETLQDDMRIQCQLVSHGVASGANDPRAAQLAGGALDWHLLLQLDSDEHAGMRWGDAGMLYYWIERDALQAKRFEDVWVVLQSD